MLRAHTPRMILIATSLVVTFAATACGESGSSGTEAPPTGAASGAGCAPIASEELVLLADDKNLQNSDNIVAAVNAGKSSPALLAAVDKVAAALDQPKLLALNKAVEIDRQTSPVAAQAFADANNLTAGLSGGSGDVVVGAAELPGEPDPGRALQDRADRGRVQRHRAAEHQPRGLRAGAGAGRDHRLPRVRGHADRVPQQEGQR